MTTQALEHYPFLMDDAFGRPDWHSLLSNLSAVMPEDWERVPPSGARSIRAIVRHIGRIKVMADDQAFGGATLTWDDPHVDGG